MTKVVEMAESFRGGIRNDGSCRDQNRAEPHASLIDKRRGVGVELDCALR